MGIPFKVVPDEEFNKQWLTQPDGSWRGYAAGTPTEAKRSGLADEAYKKQALTADTSYKNSLLANDTAKLEEEKRARSIAEALAQRNYDLDEKRTNYEIGKPYYNPSSGSSTPKLSDKEEISGSLADSYLAIDNLLAQNTDPQEIENLIYDSEADLVRRGLSIDQPLLYLKNKVATANGGPRSTGDPIKDMQSAIALKEALAQKEKERLGARPWWQKAIDILPGEQYR